MPITLDVTQAQADQLGLKSGARIALRDPRDDMALAILTGELYASRRRTGTARSFGRFFKRSSGAPGTTGLSGARTMTRYMRLCGNARPCFPHFTL